jgi:hypothetical protein
MFWKMSREKAERKLRRLDEERKKLLRIIHGSSILTVEHGEVYRSAINGGVFNVVIDEFGYVNLTIPDQGGYYANVVFPKPVMRDQVVEWLITNACERIG